MENIFILIKLNLISKSPLYSLLPLEYLSPLLNLKNWKILTCSSSEICKWQRARPKRPQGQRTACSHLAHLPLARSLPDLSSHFELKLTSFAFEAIFASGIRKFYFLAISFAITSLWLALQVGFLDLMPQQNFCLNFVCLILSGHVFDYFDVKLYLERFVIQLIII